MSSLSDALLYASAFWPRWWALVGAGAFYGLDAFLAAWCPPAKRRLDAIPEVARRRIEFGLVGFAILYAGFAAWEEEHTKYTEEHGTLISVQEQLKAAQSYYQRKVSIAEGLKNFYDRDTRLFNEGMLLNQHPQSYDDWANRVDNFGSEFTKWAATNMGQAAVDRLARWSLNPDLNVVSVVGKDHIDKLRGLANVKLNVETLLQNPVGGAP
jgi:hypothetical protein